MDQMTVIAVILFCAAAACGWISAFLIRDAIEIPGGISRLIGLAGVIGFVYGTLLAYEAWTLL